MNCFTRNILLLCVLLVLVSCKSRSGNAQDDMFAKKQEKSVWFGLKPKKKRDAYNPYVSGKKEKPSAVQARENKKALKKAKREVRREKRKLRRKKGAYQKVKSA